MMFMSTYRASLVKWSTQSATARLVQEDVASMLQLSCTKSTTLWNFMELGLKNVPGERLHRYSPTMECSCYYIRWQIQRFSEVSYEKVDFEKGRAGSRKRPLVCGYQDYCGKDFRTPPYIYYACRRINYTCALFNN